MLDREITVIYDEGIGGFTSFQTYSPDFGLSLNNRFFSWNRGILWEHHIEDVDRNEFYDQNNPSIIEVVFNDNPSDVKDFKTIGYEGDGEWDVAITTDQESTVSDSTTIPKTRTVSGNISNNDFVNRQGKKHAYIRGVTEGDQLAANLSITNLSLERLSVEGIGPATVGNNNDSIVVPNISESLSVGDNLFFFRALGTDPATYENELRLIGAINRIERATNTIFYTFSGPATQPPTTNDFLLFSKDNISESSGVIGFYGIVRFSSSDTNMVELFSVNTEITKAGF